MHCDWYQCSLPNAIGMIVTNSAPYIPQRHPENQAGPSTTAALHDINPCVLGNIPQFYIITEYSVAAKKKKGLFASLYVFTGPNLLIPEPQVCACPHVFIPQLIAKRFKEITPFYFLHFDIFPKLEGE